MVKSATRVFMIMEAVCDEKCGLTQKELSVKLDIPKSSLSVILRDLVTNEYLLMDAPSKRYLLGPQLLTMAGRYLNNQDVVEIGRPLINEAAQETGESGALALLVGWDALLVYKRDSEQPILPSIQVGTRFPLYASAVGKAILAHLPEVDIERYFKTVRLEAITPQTPTDPQILRKELQDIKAGGSAYNRNHYRMGISAIAAPVFDHTGKVAAAVSISILTQSSSPAKEALIEKAISKIADRYSRLLGYSPP